MDGLKAMLTWTFNTECPVPNDIENILVEGEKAICTYKTIRDVAIFTNKRLIVRDSQGLTGKKLRFTHCLISQLLCDLLKMLGDF